MGTTDQGLQGAAKGLVRAVWGDLSISPAAEQRCLEQEKRAAAALTLLPSACLPRAQGPSELPLLPSWDTPSRWNQSIVQVSSLLTGTWGGLWSNLLLPAGSARESEHFARGLTQWGLKTPTETEDKTSLGIRLRCCNDFMKDEILLISGLNLPHFTL